MSGTWVIAAEAVPPSSPLAQLSVPLALIAFMGTTFLLLRSNLGTKRGYLVLATSLFGFLMLFSLFWTYGAPGTPQATGPTHMPGQPSDELQPRWIPFAQDSRLAERADLSVARQFPEGFTMGDVSEEGEIQFDDLDEATTGNIEGGVDDMASFFADDVAGQQISDTDAATQVGYTLTEAGDMLIGAVFSAVDEETLEVIPEGEDGHAEYAAFAFFEEGAPLLPSQLTFGIFVILFILHAVLLDRDEQREKRELIEAAQAAEEPEKVPANA